MPITTEFIEQNFTVEVTETVIDNTETNVVEIRYEGLNATKLDALTLRVGTLEDQITTVAAGPDGAIGVVAGNLAALSAVVSALQSDVTAEPIARAAADGTIVSDRIAADAALAADIAAEPPLRIAADAAEVVARDAAIVAALAPLISDISVLEGTVVSITADVLTLGSTQVTLDASFVALTADFAALSAEFGTWTTTFTDVSTAVTDEIAARAAAEAVIVASIPTTEGIQDLVAAMLIPGSNIDLTYDDTAGTITVDVEALVASDIGDFSEAVDNRVADLLVEGDNIVLAYNDGANSLTISTRLTAYTVATLPVAGTAGRQARVTDGDAALAWGATVVNTGAGATPYAVWDNGTNWTVMGM
jgi:hypothetical protein